MNRFSILTATAVLALGALSPLAARASGDVTLTAPATGSMLAADGSIIVVVSEAVPQDRFADFYLLFDGDDITGIVSVDGRTVTYRPPQSLGPGDHVLRMVEKTGENAFSDLAQWAIHVGGASGGPLGPGLSGVAQPDPGTHISGVLQGQVNRTIADNLRGDDTIPPNTADAALSMKAAAGGDNWQLNGGFSGYAGPTAKHNPDKDAVELGEYSVVLQSHLGDVTSTLTAGDHDAGVSNLLVDKFLRRGVTADLDLGTHFSIMSFAQDPARTVGNSNISGLEDDNRVEGAFARYYPLDSYGRRVFTEAGYYAGKGLQGSAPSGLAPASTQAEEGSGWLVAAEGQTLDDKANLRGEYSEVKIDEDGSGTVLSPTTEDAWRARMQYAPIGTLDPADGASQKWLLQANYSRFGTYYRSLANIGDPMDDERVTLTSRYTHDSYSFVSEGYIAQNNTDNIASLPTDDGYGLLAQFAVKPDYFIHALKPDSLLGRSTFTWGGNFAGQARVTTPATYIGDGNDQSLWICNAAWTAVYDKYNFTLSHTYSNFDNRAVTGSDYVTNFSQLAVTWNPTPRFSLTPSTQAQVKKDVTGTSTQIFGSIDAATQIIPDKLTNTFHYSAVFDHNGPAEDQHDLFTEFDYRLREPARNRPGFTLALSGNYDLGNTVSSLTSPLTLSPTMNENYKIYLALKMDAPFGF